MQPLRCVPALLLCLLAALAPPSFAGDEPPVGPPAPEKTQLAEPINPPPAAMRGILKRRLDRIIEVISGDVASADSISFTERYLSTTPRDEALKSLRERGQSGSKYEVLETRFANAASINAWARDTNKRGSFITIRLSVEQTRPHRIDSLEIAAAAQPGTDSARAWRDFDEAIASKPFRTAMIAVEVNAEGPPRVIHATNPDERLGIGTFGMLFTHLALAELIGEGGTTWDKLLSIAESLRSLPDSPTSRLPGGTEMPLLEYARRAMLRGDSTCADHLVAHLGRERVELARDRVRATAAAHAGIDPLPGGEPFLTIMENYRLKCGVSTLISRYASATNGERRALLEAEVPNAEIDLTLLELWKKPQELLRVGWTATPRELAEAGTRLIELARRPGNGPAIDALRPMGSRRQASGLPQPISLSAGEPGAQASLWIDERAEGRAIIMAIIFNIEKRPLPEQETAALFARAVEIVSMTP